MNLQGGDLCLQHRDLRLQLPNGSVMFTVQGDEEFPLFHGFSFKVKSLHHLTADPGLQNHHAIGIDLAKIANLPHK